MQSHLYYARRSKFEVVISMNMMKLGTLNAIGYLLFSTSWNVEGRLSRSPPIYRVQSDVEKRDLKTAIFDPKEMLLSFSDDGADKLDEFYLDIFDTPEILTDSESPMAISNAMNFFLLEELNLVFDELNAIEKVSSEIVHLKTRNGTYVNASGFDTDRIGTEARMKVILSFAQTPSPKSKDVDFALKYVMSNLSNFVTNLTGSVSTDNELSGVYEAIRREIRPVVLVRPPPDQTIIVEGQGEVGGPSDIFAPNLITTTVPIVVGVAVLAAVLVFFVFKKRKKPTESDSAKSSEMMYDVKNEIFSMDRSVESGESPLSKNSPKSHEESSIQYSLSADSGMPSDAPGCDSIFSGIDTEYGTVLSPKSLSSPRSMMTGITCASASTIRASNVEKKKTKSKSPAGGNSVFNFLDPIEDADEEDLDDLEQIERAQPTSNLDVDIDNDHSENGNVREPENGTESSSSSSSSPLEGVSIDLRDDSKKEELATISEVSTADPVSHVLADLENMETKFSSVPRDVTTVNKVQTEKAIDSTQGIQDDADDEEKVDENKKEDDAVKTALSVATKASNIMSGFFKGKRKSTSTPSSPTSSPTNGGSFSAPASPMQQVGRHWLTSPEKNPSSRIPISPNLDVNIDYDMMLSHPSPGEENYNSTRGFNDSINDNMQIVDRAPQYPPDLDPTGGRRHAGDKIGGDGSALYQATAMKPTDWSYRSSDVGSVGSSTTDGEGSQNQSNASKITESKKSVFASRQLINDLVWLEKKIATVRGETKLTRSNQTDATEDSVLYDSNGDLKENNESSANSKDLSNIVCRDCFAPPGKLQIVIHSTKDGPAVHTVKDGSSLEGDIFPGDLIISVDNIDTRTFTAEEVMKMMASKGDKERKITVLRFLDDN